MIGGESSRWIGRIRPRARSATGKRSKLRLQLLPYNDSGIVEGDCEATKDTRYHHVMFFERQHDGHVIGKRSLDAKCLPIEPFKPQMRTSEK